MVELLPISVRNVAQFKATRLAALKDSPSAFGSTWIKESQMSDEDWLRRAKEWGSERSVGFLAIEALEPCGCGLVGGFIDSEDASRAQVISMWVAPAQRRTGIGFGLLQAVVDWAADRNARTIRLTVTNNNESAIAFYGRSGFSMTGRTEPYPNDPNLFEYEMSRSLSTKKEN